MPRSHRAFVRTFCKDCGAPGHRAKTGSCPAKKIAARQNPYGLDLPRPEVQEVMPFDPALREATLRTIFLGSG